MKPFDLEKAKAGARVCTRDGRDARIICFDCKSEDHPIIALMSTMNGYEACVQYTKKGTVSAYGEKCDFDLMMVPEKIEGWVSLYRSTNEYTWCGDIFTTKEAAVENARDDSSYITTIKIEWEE